MPQKTNQEVISEFERLVNKAFNDAVPSNHPHFTPALRAYVASGLKAVIAQTINVAVAGFKDPKSRSGGKDVQTQSNVSWYLDMEGKWMLGTGGGGGGDGTSAEQDPRETSQRYIDIIATVRSRYPPQTDDAIAWEITNEAAKAIRAVTGDDNWGLHRKGGKNHKGYAIDIIAHRTTGRMYDVLGAAGDGGPANPQWLRVNGSLNWAPPE